MAWVATRHALVEATDNRGYTAMMLGAFYCGGDSADLFRVLLDAGGAIDRRALHDSAATALHFAASAGRARCAEALVALGADPAAANGDGKTAADLARAHANPETRSKLLAVLTLPPPENRR